MPRIHVCPLSRLEATVNESGASHLVTLLGAMSVRRPVGIARERHLRLNLHDIAEPVPGQRLPDAEHVAAFLKFVRGWDQTRPIVIHCFAGISRSTAGAFIAFCALRPEREEAAIARELRSASPSAMPNRRLVALGDGLLERQGRMIAAVEAMGAASHADEAVPFHLALA